MTLSNFSTCKIGMIPTRSGCWHDEKDNWYETPNPMPHAQGRSTNASLPPPRPFLLHFPQLPKPTPALLPSGRNNLENLTLIYPNSTDLQKPPTEVLMVTALGLSQPLQLSLSPTKGQVFSGNYAALMNKTSREEAVQREHFTCRLGH